MGLRRPGTIIRFWTPKVRNQAHVSPPALLKIISILCIFSIMGTIVYSLYLSLDGLVFNAEMDPSDALSIAVLHFLVPFAVAVSISTNSPLSRPLITLYFLIASLAALMGRGYFAAISINPPLHASLTLALGIVVVGHLHASRKMRAYYALLRGDEVPAGTGDAAIDLIENPWPGERTRALLNWVAEHLETVVIIGLIVAVVLGWRSMNNQ